MLEPTATDRGQILIFDRRSAKDETCPRNTRFRGNVSLKFLLTAICHPPPGSRHPVAVTNAWAGPAKSRGVQAFPRKRVADISLPTDDGQVLGCDHDARRTGSGLEF